MSPRSGAWGAYSRIAETLLQRVASGGYPPDSRLPSEVALCGEFGVVRNTVRRALAVLEADGLITTLPGIGRVVRDPAADPPTDQFLPQYRRIAEELRQRIERGELVPGGLVPSEGRIVAYYGVSRYTARQALAELEAAELVVSVHGKGRFVRRRS